MKKIIFFGLPAYGHINPTLNVAKELVKRGNIVLFYSTEEFKSLIESAGVYYRSYQYSFDFDRSITRDMGLLAQKCITLTDKKVLSILEEVKKENPDCIVHDGGALWGKLISQKLSIPAISVCCTLASHYSLWYHYPLECFGAVIKNKRNISKAFVMYWHLAIKYRMKTYRFEDLYINKEPLTIIFTSKSYHPCAKYFDASFAFVGPSIAPRNEKNDFLHKLKKNRKIIYISLGTIVNDNIAFYKMCLDAFKNSSYQVVISLGGRFDPEMLGKIPENIIVRRYMNQLDLLQHVDLFVTHAGMNGINESLYYGVPMVLIPDTEEQTVLALRVQELGAGICLDKEKLTKKQLITSVEKVLYTDSFVEKAIILQKELRKTGGYKEAADRIEDYLVNAKKKS
jgi:MGT family glycosyltransferase